MPARRTDIVTFLFTDVEGSTRLWQDYERAMSADLALHDALLRRVIESAGGQVFKTVGDAFYAAFAMPVDALRAAVLAQREMIAEPWRVPGGLRVRMAVHSGSAERRHDDYFGPTLNRIARLLTAGHGGQILVSQPVQALLGDELPAGVNLADLGMHRLKDVDRPEHIFQATVEGLRDAFPSLRSLDAFPNNLPRQLTSFIGRDQDLAKVTRLLETTPLLTMTGPGGSGKTRLALEVGQRLLETYPGGVWWVDLTPLSDPDYLPQTVAGVLGIREQPGRPLLEAIGEYLKSSKILLILDNCEHVAAACADLASALLRSAPDLTVLATSQVSLAVPGEVVHSVPPLTVPDPRDDATAESLVHYDAVRLFIERARSVRPSFTFEGHVRTIAEITARLDGIPLAIELAAARVKVLSIEEISHRLADRFRLLASSARGAPARHQALRAAMEWSYNLLTHPEQILLRRLSVFAGHLSLEAAEAVCADDQVRPDAMLDLLTRLVDKSLVAANDQGEIRRFRLLESVRHYVRERLQEAGEEHVTGTRHLDVFLNLAEQGESPHLSLGQIAWLNRMALEYGNLRGALEWALIHDPPKGLRLAGSCWLFWAIRGSLAEGRDWFERALQAGADAGSTERAKALIGLSVFTLRQGDFARAFGVAEEALALCHAIDDRAGVAMALLMQGGAVMRQGDYRRGMALLEESLKVARDAGDLQGIGNALQFLGYTARHQVDFDRATTLLTESVKIFEAIGDEWSRADSQHNLALIARRLGDYDRAARLHEETLQLFRALGDIGGVASTENSLGLIAIARGNYESAHLHLEDALAVFRKLGDKGGIGLALYSLGLAALKSGDHALAAELCQEGLDVRRAIGDRRGIAECLEALGAVAVGQMRWEQAARRLGAATRIREIIGVPLAPAERAEVEELMVAVRRGLRDQTLSAIVEEVRKVPLEQLLQER